MQQGLKQALEPTPARVATTANNGEPPGSSKNRREEATRHRSQKWNSDRRRSWAETLWAPGGLCMPGEWWSGRENSALIPLPGENPMEYSSPKAARVPQLWSSARLPDPEARCGGRGADAQKLWPYSLPPAYASRCRHHG
jgi:hypothetical protein